VKEIPQRATATKKKIEQVFIKARAPISLKLLYSKVAAELPRTAYSTVFRIVKKYEEQGKLMRVNWKDRGAFYEWADMPHHHHLVCEKCDEVTDVTDQVIAFNAQKVTSVTGFIITNHSVELGGICAPCQKK